MSARINTIYLGLAMASMACAGGTESLMDDGAGASGALPEEAAEVAVASEALDRSVVAGPFNWDNSYASSTPLKPSGTHVCVLTKVQGGFLGNGERLRVFQRNNGSTPYWYLGEQGVQSLQGTAYCFAWSAFLGASPTSKWYSGDMSVRTWAYGTQSCVLGICSTDVHAGHDSIDAWWGDATTVVQGMSGRFDGAGEAVWATQVNDGFTPSKLEVQSASWAGAAGAQTNYVYGNSFFVGAAGTGSLAKFYGPNSTSPGKAGDVGEYSVSYSGKQFMAETSKAMCHFTYIAGKFRGGGERAEIRPEYDKAGVERWVLETSTGQNGIYARARCYAFDQR